MLTRRAALGLIAAAPLLPHAAAAATSPVFTPNGLAIHGTDPVAYFAKGAPVPGVSSHQLSWRGSLWQFESAENLSKFEMNPEAYAPQYGGYCAYAASQGYIADTVPEAWTIHNDRLYLNYSTGVRRRWLKDIDGFIMKGDANWPAILNA